MPPPFGEGHLANQNARFQSHDSRQEEDGSYFCSVMQHNVDKHSLLQVHVCLSIGVEGAHMPGPRSLPGSMTCDTPPPVYPSHPSIPTPSPCIPTPSLWYTHRPATDI